LSRFEALKTDKTNLKTKGKKNKTNGVSKPLVFFCPFSFYAFGVSVFLFASFFTALLCGFLPLFFAL